VRVHSTKYDGSLHYRYATELVSAGAGELRLFTPAGTACESYRGPVEITHPTLMVYWSDRPWNVHLSWFPDGRLRHWYVNVASPATWDDGVLRFVDLDLDVILRASGEIVVLDEDDLARHRVRFGYPDALVERIHETVAEVRDAMDARVSPFDDSLVGWLASRAG
jgi:protein associated with RNAse G/E